MSGRERIKPIDVLRHELKALRFILDNFHSGRLQPGLIPPRDDFQSEQSRQIFDAIMASPTREAAEERITALQLEEVDIDSFLDLSGEHYYAYPALVRQRAEAIRRGTLAVEDA